MDKSFLHTMIREWLNEDVGRGDITSETVFPDHETGSARLVARGSFVAAGVESVAAEVFRVQNPEIITHDAVSDGTQTRPSMSLLSVSGPVSDLIKPTTQEIGLLTTPSSLGRYKVPRYLEVE